MIYFIRMGALPELDRRPLRFGVFELDPLSGELRKHGVRVRLQDQPLKLLLCLIESPGEICTREDLIRAIWPDGTFVDYERGLNVAITRLRQVLGDSADSPRYIETLGRKGYRFIAPLERMPALEIIQPPDERQVIVPPPREKPEPFLRWWPYGIRLRRRDASGAFARWDASGRLRFPPGRQNRARHAPAR